MPDADFLANRSAPLPDLESRFNTARSLILRHHPEEEVGQFVPMDGLDVMHHDDLEILKVRAEVMVRWIERRGDEVQAKVDEAEQVRAEGLRQKNLTEDQAWREKIERALAYQAGEIAKLKGTQLGRLPALPHVARSEVPQFLGMPSGLGRHAVVGGAGGAGGARKLAAGGPGQTLDAPSQPAFTRRQHPLDVIGGKPR